MPIFWGDQALKRIPPGDERYGEASLVVGQPRRLRGVEITPLPPDDEIYTEGTITVGTPMRPKPSPVEEPPPGSSVQEKSAPRDWTGFKPIPKFRDPLPGESRQEWWDARKVFVDDFQDKVLAERDRARVEAQARLHEGP